jgi:photosystem II stability/assembly factor-like uncharacterized protein
MAGLAMATAGARAELPTPLTRPATVLRQPAKAALLGVAQAGERVVAVGERGTVLLSDDAGMRWRQAASVPVSVTLTAVQFINQRVGWAVGHCGVVLRSDDGGEHWHRQLDGHAAAALMLKDAQALGDEKAVAEAQRVVQEGADKPLLSLHFVDEREGWVVGAFNLALVTHDGGQTWASGSTRLPNPKAGHLYALHREKDELLIAGELGLLLHSADAGRHFERIEVPYAGSFFVVNREPSGAWVVAGLRGHALRSLDQGKTWTALASPVPVSFTSLLAEPSGGTWLANQAGQIWKAEPHLNTLQPQAPSAAQQPASLLRLADGTLLLAGWNGISRVPASPRSTTLR